MQNRLVPLILVLVAAAGCRVSDRHIFGTRGDARLVAEEVRGPDPILLRIPRGGGTARAYLYPKLDSVIWTGDATSVERVLGFDPDGGVLGVVNAAGEPSRIDLRLGEAAVASSARLVSLASANGTDIYGVNGKGEVIRLTRSGNWSFTPPIPARAVFPEANGGVVVVASRDGETTVWRIHPPESRILDTTVLRLPLRASGARAQVGDRVYFGADTGMVGVKTRDLSIVPPIRLPGEVDAIAPTPSGDRVYVSTVDEQGVSVIDRYTEKVSGEIPLPGSVSELRMDPLGRYVIARPTHGDSAWVIAVATDRLVGTIQTRWTGDLPACAPDGAIAINTGQDVVFLDGQTLQSVRTVVDGAKDFWYFMFWNGFRPRASSLDQPVSFGGRPDSDTTAADTAHKDTTKLATTAPDSAATGGGGAARPAPPPPAAPAPVNPAPPPSPVSVAPAPLSPRPANAAPQRFFVSFAAMLTSEKAHALADSISVSGTKARVMPAVRAGTTVYRVVLGPYSSRAVAEQSGRAAQRTFWVYPESEQ